VQNSSDPQAGKQGRAACGKAQREMTPEQEAPDDSPSWHTHLPPHVKDPLLRFYSEEDLATICRSLARPPLTTRFLIIIFPCQLASDVLVMRTRHMANQKLFSRHCLYPQLRSGISAALIRDRLAVFGSIQSKRRVNS
jgi:hypothetical protein